MNWVVSFLINRSTILKINKYILGKIYISTKILQKSLLSPILFLFYKLPLLKKLNLEPNLHSARFVNEITILVEDNTTKDNNPKLLNIYKRIYKLWAMKHGSKFAL